VSEQRTTVISPSELASLLGVDRSRLHLEVKSVPAGGGTLVSVEMLIDGKDLTDEQTAIVRWVSERVQARFVAADKA